MDLSNGPEPCVVCGDAATGYHYRCMTCEGCKVGFNCVVRQISDYFNMLKLFLSYIVIYDNTCIYMCIHPSKISLFFLPKEAQNIVDVYCIAS